MKRLSTAAVGLAFVAAGALFLAAACAGGETPAPSPTPVASVVGIQWGMLPADSGFVDANGAHLFYEVWGEGEPLLLLPGLGLNHQSWQYEIPAYMGEFKVIAFDPRGTGLSSFPEGVDVTTALLADDAAALLDSLDVDAAHVLGWSLGGMVAQEMALRHPEKVRSLILGAATPGGSHSVPSEDWAEAALTAFLTQGRDVTTPNFLEIVFSPAYLADHHSEAVEYVGHLNSGVPAPLQAIMAQAQAITAHDTYDRLPGITAPTLILQGADDRLVPAENARILAERIPGAELILLEGARHAYQLEKRAEVDAAVLDFLRRHPL